MRIQMSLAVLALMAVAVWMWVRLSAPASLSEADFAARYTNPLPPTPTNLSVYHLGHSLVGRDMPSMLSQLGGHDHALQLGWGASLKAHWTGDIPGFEEENATPRFQPALSSLGSGDFPVVVLTEMVEIRDAIRYFASAQHLANWATRIRKVRPDARIYLYETWHRLDDPEGWLERIDTDLARHWEGDLLRHAMAKDSVGTIYVIPGGQVMAATVRAAEAGKIPGLTDRGDLFAKLPDGSIDTIHFNDLGAYLMALTHYATIYQRSPEGLPATLTRADGSPVTPIAAETANALQRIVWEVVTGYALTGVPQQQTGG
ncbi:hypothetical protein ACSBLW_11725 [Thioclava sp. FR2]|uniref:hypothetical protein n=1 Tax=Thioclava sp. FR2 TaxID=3445780 RepID=UPI003EBFBCC9